ncbi:hypothetical protein FA95DRAFT_1564926 [Auriscalpium vulgare]|uniref:Uncharacterized protein n=1 Tax=Auriscalpium vulgare TaxID=40419 RepID=A0ACB8RCI4_9AGAM|nr:hypothetical protein FA95DRAFT_1564926 [Auriscalpium vulgare]
MSDSHGWPVAMLALVTSQAYGTDSWSCPAPEVLQQFMKEIFTDVQPQWIAAHSSMLDV